MLYSFQLTKILRELNSEIKIFATGRSDGEGRPATIYYRGMEVCSVSKKEMPERTMKDEQGHIISRGWKDLFRILADRKLIDYNEAVYMARFER